MTFLFRTLCAVIGAAFLFAVANLVMTGLPSGTSSVELASDAAPLPPGTLRDVPEPLLGGASSPVNPVAAPSALTAGIEADWRAWAEVNGIREAALVVLLPNGSMHRVEIGRAASTSVPVASLSKAITGICMDVVLREHGLSWYTSLGDIGSQMSAAGVTPQRWNERITLASLANHTSGLAPDLTQGTMGSTLHGALGLHRRIASEALREENMQGTARTYFYNNTNYAVLGVAIEALTGQSYAQACAERVLAPAGVNDALIHGAMGSRSAYGGWEMSAEAYARLAQHWFSGATDLVDRPFDRPMHDNYSIGYIIHGRGDAAQISHAGHFCDADGSGTGAYFHARGDGTVVSANWSGGCVAATDTRLDIAIANRM